MALFMPALPGSLLCPVLALLRAMCLIPAASEALAFMSLGGLLLTPRELTPQLWDALHAAGVPEAESFTLHGLR